MTSLYDEIRELQEQVQRLQGALQFWLPSVPEDGPADIAARISADSYMLIGYEPEEEPGPDAETLGWIRLSHSIGNNHGR